MIPNMGRSQAPIFEPVDPTGLPYSVIVDHALVNEGKLPDSTQVGLFDGNLCVGAAYYRTGQLLQLVAWESDAIQNLDGFLPGHTIDFKVRIKCLDNYRIVDGVASFTSGSGSYGSGNFSLVELNVQDTSCLPQCAAAINLVADRVAVRSAVLRWTCNSDFATYTLKGREIGSPNWVSIDFSSGFTSEFRATGLSPTSTYEWQIKKSCDQQQISQSCWSEIDTFTTSCLPPATTGTIGVGANSATASWTQVNNASGYELRGKKVGRPWDSFQISAGTTSLTINTLKAGSTYAWQVRTICDATGTSFSKFTDIDTFMTLSAKFDFEGIGQAKTVFSPNPFSDRISVNSSAKFDGYWLEIFDLSGKSVFSTSNQLRGELKWDGRSNFGTELIPGHYLLLLRNSEHSCN